MSFYGWLGLLYLDLFFYTVEYICLCNETTESLTHTVISEKIENLPIPSVLGKHMVCR